MVVDIRQHIITLAAVFLALGMGILIGMALVEDRALVDQQRKMIDRLEADFAALSRDRDQLRARLNLLESELKASRKLLEEIFSKTAVGRLQGRRIAIIAVGDSLDDKEIQGVTQAIEYAGGQVSSITKVLRPFSLSKEDDQTEMLGLLGGRAGQGEEFGEALMEDLVSAVVGGGNLTIVPALESLGFIACKGDMVGPVDAALIITGTQTQPEIPYRDAGAHLVNALKARGMRIVVAEPSGPTVSQIKNYISSGCTTVDDVDTPLGRIALVLALAGADGNFGFRDGAKRILPNDFLAQLIGQ
ncbi:MAG TPA: copper transporter [Firmicutes bacterium]|nr:copper transporter [Bacillota bacterium]